MSITDISSSKFSKPDLTNGSQILPTVKFSKQDFVIELYDLFHKYLKKNVKDFDEIQTIYQSAFTELLSKHKLKKLFTNVPRKGDLYYKKFSSITTFLKQFLHLN